MSLINKPMAKKSKAKPLPPKLSRLLRESSWLLLVGAALYLLLIFISYDRADPGWSHSGYVDSLQNTGGYIGAWLADLLLFLFGISAWWWIMFFLSAVFWSYRRIDVASIFDKRSLLLSAAGFGTLLMASSGLESLRLYSLDVTLPQMAAGY